MPPANIDATIILLDIGKNTSTRDVNGNTFFKNARDCVARIIERKIISRPKDLLAIIVMGSKRSKNRLAEQTDSFQHIEYLTTRITDEEESAVLIGSPTWDMLEKLPEKPTKYEADWFEGLIVAADAFKNGLYGTKVTNKKVVLITNFTVAADLGDKFDKVVTGFKSEGIEVNVFGPNLEKSEVIEKESVGAICQLVEATDGVTTTLEDAMRYLLFHRTKAVKPMPWNVDLSIGPNIKIPISAYGRIRDVKVIGTWQKAFKDPVTDTASLTDGIAVKKEYFRSDDNVPMDVDDIISGYYYGQKLVPFSDTDKSMLYESGLRGLQVYGFTPATKVYWQCLAGDGVSYIFGKNGKAQQAILSLVRALQEMNLVGIARRVYNNGNAPTMFALFPCIDSEHFYCLSSVALVYKDDIKGLNFPATNLKKFEPSEQEVDAFKSLIDSMDLMTAYEGYDDEEAIPVLETVNPSVQYVLDCLAFRAVNPDKPLPPPREDILTPFKPPEKIEKSSKVIIEKLKQLLTLQTVEKKTRKPRPNNTNSNLAANPTNGNDAPNQSVSTNFNISMNDDETVTYIGTVDPVGDFKALLHTGKTLYDLAEEIKLVIENLVYLNFDNDYTKSLSTIRAFREESVKGDPQLFNYWMKEFKRTLAQRSKVNFLQILRHDKLDLIVEEENDKSDVKREELEDNNPLYEVDTVPHLTELTIRSEVCAMFDDM